MKLKELLILYKGELAFKGVATMVAESAILFIFAVSEAEDISGPNAYKAPRGIKLASRTGLFFF